MIADKLRFDTFALQTLDNMSSLIVDDTPFDFDPYTGMFAGEKPFRPDCRGTSLIISSRELPVTELTFSLADISQLPPAALCGSLVYSTAGLLRKFGGKEPFISLDSEFSLSAPENIKLLPVVFFFYLNTIPFSTDLMSEWLQEEGCKADVAGNLATAIYMARVDYHEEYLIELNDLPSRAHISQSELREETEKLFSRSDFQEISYAYDLFTFYKTEPGTKKKDYLLTDYYPESGLLLQDHDHLVLGLGVTLLELTGMAGTMLPELCNYIRNEYFVWERSQLSLGGILQRNGRRIMDEMMKNVRGGAIFFADRHYKYSFRHLSEINPDNILERPFGQSLPIYLILNY